MIETENGIKKGKRKKKIKIKKKIKRGDVGSANNLTTFSSPLSISE